jgi:hypothetical protein
VTALRAIVRELRPEGLLCAGDQLVLAQCHHYALFLEQTAHDALGGESLALRRQAAFEAAHALLGPIAAERRAATAREKLDLAADLFAAMGHGRLRFEIGPEGGAVQAEALHNAASFLVKYGGRVQGRVPLDAFAAGYCSAAASLAFPSDWGRLEAEEVACAARGDPACAFVLTRRPERPRFGAVVTRKLVEQAQLERGARAEEREDDAGDAARARRAGAAMIGSLEADERGLISAWGVQVALLPVSYAGQVTYETMHLIEKRSPELFPVLEALVREGAQTGAFHLLGGMLASPEFSTLAGPVGKDQPRRLQQLLGLSRALGWGAFTAPEFTAGRSLTLRSPVTHESAYHAIRHGATVRNRLAFQQGTALAIMQLLHRVDFGLDHPIEADTYPALFRSGTRFHVEETQSPLRGDAFCEVRVEAMADRW